MLASCWAWWLSGERGRGGGKSEALSSAPHSLHDLEQVIFGSLGLSFLHCKMRIVRMVHSVRDAFKVQDT